MSTHEIVVDDLTFGYPGSDETVLRDANLTIGSDEFTAVVGGNGSGKTTLCKTFNGLVPHFFEGRFEGSVTVAGTDTRASDVAELSTRVGYVFQDFENQLVQETVRADVEFGPLNYGFDDYAERATRALETVGLDHLDDRFIWELSGSRWTPSSSSWTNPPHSWTRETPGRRTNASVASTRTKTRRSSSSSTTPSSSPTTVRRWCLSLTVASPGRNPSRSVSTDWRT
jgi:hypothetical protein